MKLLGWLTSRRNGTKKQHWSGGRTHTIPFAPPRPEEPIWLIGDIHGCMTKLEDLLSRISRSDETGARLIFVGDYVDRGEDSARVLELVADLERSGAVALFGNHEAMMMDFLNMPQKKGNRWLRFGGLQTLASYGIGGVSEASSTEKLIEASDALGAALSSSLMEWLRERPVHWTSGNLHVVHAAADPALPLEMQERRTLLWGHPSFGQVQRTDNQWVAHGHTITDTPGPDGLGHIPLDTGAFAGGPLTAVLLRPDGTFRIEQA